jgi:hypothetical protein
MTYAQLINAVKTALRPLAEAADGKLVVAESLEEAQKFLGGNPRTWRIILHWEGFGEHPLARQGLTYHQVATVIQAPRGLAHNQEPTERKTSGDPGFHAYIEMVSGWMRALRFPDGTGADDAGFSTAGSQWLPTAAGYAAHTINWQLEAAEPGYETTIPLTFPHLT